MRSMPVMPGCPGILEGLIERQASNGNATILLSATLSQQQRDKLVAAFSRGVRRSVQAPLLGHDDYPRADSGHTNRADFSAG